MKIKIQDVNDDWTRVYKDGILIDAGHSINIEKLLKAMDIDVEREQVYECVYCEDVVGPDDRNRDGDYCCDVHRHMI